MDTSIITPAASQRAALIPWRPLAWWGALLIVCYAPVLLHLVRQWYNDPDVGHGFFVPLVAGYIVWQKKDILAQLKPRPNWWGLVIVIYAAVQLYLATLGAELFLARTAFVFSLIGMVLFLGGSVYLRALAFPLFLLFFMIPIPAIIYNQITFPLQLIASRVAEATLSALGVPVLREGNVLELANRKLSVVDACSGIRSLLSLSFLSLVYGYLVDEKNWMRVLLFVATIPIAILANASRVTLSGLLGLISPELGEGVFHTAEGWVVFLVALAMLAAFHQAVSRLRRVFR